MSGSPGMSGDADRKAIEALDDRIAAARQKLEGPARVENTKYKSLTFAWQMILELVVGVVIGGSIGYALDWAFGTVPLFLIVFCGFGLAAGIKTMLATARNFAEKDAAQGAATEGEGFGR